MSEEGENLEKQKWSTVLVLEHPSGSPIHVVGTLYLSPESLSDVKKTLQEVEPAVVVLPLSSDELVSLRKALESNGPALSPPKFPPELSILQFMSKMRDGSLLEHMILLANSVASSLSGTSPADEPAAVLSAAESAQIVLCGRDMQVVVNRSLRLMSALRQSARGSGVRLMDGKPREQLDKVLDGLPVWPSEGVLTRPPQGRDGTNVGISPTDAPRQGQDEEWGVDVRSGSFDALQVPPYPPQRPSPASEPLDPLQSSSIDRERAALGLPPRAFRATLEDVAGIAHRILAAGVDSKAVVNPADVAAARRHVHEGAELARQCAGYGLPHFAAEWGRLMWHQAVGSMHARDSLRALQHVTENEAAEIEAVKLYEAGVLAGGRPVLGLAPASLLPAIARAWPQAGTPASADRARALEVDPWGPAHGAGKHPTMLSRVVTAAAITGFGLFAWRRPRAFAFLVGSATVLSAPAILFTWASLNRFQHAAVKISQAAQRLESNSGGWEDAEI